MFQPAEEGGAGGFMMTQVGVPSMRLVYDVDRATYIYERRTSTPTRGRLHDDSGRSPPHEKGEVYIVSAVYI